MRKGRWLPALVLLAMVLCALTGCAKIFGVRDALESAERAKDTAKRDNTFKTSVTMIEKARSYEYDQFALYDKNNESLGIISRGDKPDDITVVYIPGVEHMLAGAEELGYGLYYLALLGAVDDSTGMATAVLFSDNADSPPTVIARTNFKVPPSILDKVKDMDIYNKTLPCPVYDIAVASQAYGNYEPTETNISTLKNAKTVSDLNFESGGD